MSVFDRPTWLKPATTVTRTMKPERLTIEGKWANIRRIVKDLVADGWRHDTPEPNDDFTRTTVTLER